MGDTRTGSTGSNSGTNKRRNDTEGYDAAGAAASAAVGVAGAATAGAAQIALEAQMAAQRLQLIQDRAIDAALEQATTRNKNAIENAKTMMQTMNNI